MLSTSKSKLARSWGVDLFCIAVILGIFYALWIGGHALFTPDEGRYSEIAREMIVTGDYITPRLNGVAFLDKPVLYYWLQASAIHAFGLKEWALRFWPALFGVLGCLMVYASGRQLFNRRTGILSAIILATSPLYYGAAHYANLDLEVATLVSITLLFSALALHSASARYRSLFFILAYLFCGLAALTKGLIGIVFPTLIIGLWIVLLNRWRVIKQMHLITGLVIFFAITVPWYYLVQQANPEFLHFFFVTQQVSRFLTHGDFNNRTVIWFYIPIVLIGFFPWCFFAIQAVGQYLKTAWRNRHQHTVELFLLIWLIFIFTFFSIPKSKTIGYIIPLFPALALIVGHYLDQQWESAQSSGLRNGIGLFIGFSVIIAITALAAPHLSALHLSAALLPYLSFTALIFLLSAIRLYQLLKRKAPNSKMIYVLIILASVGMLTLSASTTAINIKSIKPLANVLKLKLTADDEVVAYYKYYQDLPLYLERRITIVADWNAPDIAKKDNWLRELWFGMPFQNTKDWLIDDHVFWHRWSSNKHLFVIMSENDYPRFLVKAKNSIRQIGQYRDVIWVSNQ